MKTDVTPEQWADALESGDYKQGKKTDAMFKSDNGFCCLGVLADLMGDLRSNDPAGIDSRGIFPSGSRPEWLSRNQEDRATGLNDGVNLPRRRTFKEIASWIRKGMEVPA